MEFLANAEQRQAASQTAQLALDNQAKARELFEKASACEDPAEREAILKEALDKEIEARSQGKTATWLNSGGLQGALGGLSVGGAIGGGLGTVTGALVGATTSVAIGGLGALIGGGVGLIHGPWKRFGPSLLGGASSDETKQQEALKNAAVEINNQAEPAPEMLAQIAHSAGNAKTGMATNNGTTPPPRRSARIQKKRPEGAVKRPRKTDTKPKKLEVRRKGQEDG
jgi:hypothetical protein